MKKTIRFAFQKSFPILFGYVFMGFAFGVMLTELGYHPIWAFLISMLVYSGSLQFVMISLLSGGAALPTIGLMTLLVNFRHIFYGLSFLDKVKQWGKYTFYNIFALTDETYSVLCSCQFPENINEKKATFLIALFNHCYWIIGSLLGAVIGSAIPLDMEGVDFSMTALFIVIFIDQWRAFPNHLPAFTGLICAAVFLPIMGPDSFLVPALLTTVLILMLLKRRIGKEAE